MSMLDGILRMDALVFLHTWGEPVVYYPGGDVSKGRTILAVVDRTPPRPVDPKAPRTRDAGLGLTITVANDPVQGVDVRTWSQQTDSFDVPVKGPGAAMENRKARAGPLSVDAGMVKIPLT